jgi:large subunit ribosomal protein L13e
VQRRSDPANAEAPKEASEMHHIKPKITKKDGKHRDGRGFSLEELEKAGLNKAEAKKLEIPVDKRRKTAHDQNVEAVKAYAENKKAEAKPKQKPQPKKKAKK